jgi:large subunit ribosomal protein L6
MSRIGKMPVEIPDKVTVKAESTRVTVEGPRGVLERDFMRGVNIEVKDGAVVVNPTDGTRLARDMHGTARSIIASMVTGVTDGYKKELEINGVGFRAVLSGNVLDMNLGYSHPINFNIPEGITITVRDTTKLTVEGNDKQMVGEVAARIKRFYPVEPYKGKGVRIVGQHVRRKEGKKAG